MHKLANPARFLRLARALSPWLWGGAAAAIAAGLWLGLVASPPDYQQGETVRIMYVHVPAAWMALFAYLCLALAGAAALIWRHPVAELAGRAIAPVGAGFTVICLATGSLWGAPMWGAWWVWDARLTSVLVLLFLYLGYIALSDAFEDPSRGGRAAAVLALAGVVNLPIIKFSVDWWNTLHQPASVSRLDAPAVHGDMLIPLLVMALGFKLLFAALACARTETEILRRKARLAALATAEAAATRAPAEAAAGD